MDSDRQVDPPAGAAAGRGRARLRRLGVLGATFCATWIAVDLALAHLLFGESVPSWAEELRHPARWASEKDELYHRLRAEWMRTPKDKLWESIGHPDFGWIAGAIDAETLRHREEDELRDRRPILLFGDSFARGVGRRVARFQGLLERSELEGEHMLLNYGTGGFGTDQILLLMRAAVPLYVERDPIVIFSFLLDDDLDRSVMGFKSGVRPRLETNDAGELVAAGPCTPRAEYFERFPTPRFGYGWRLLARATLWPEPVRDVLSGETRRIERVHALNRRIFEAVRNELDALGVTWFVLIFHGHHSAPATEPWEPHERFVFDTLRELEIPFVSTRRDLWRATDGNAEAIADLFIPDDQVGGAHYTPRGHVAAFEAIRRGLQGRFQTRLIEWPEPDDGFRPQTALAIPEFVDARIERPDERARVEFRNGGSDTVLITPSASGPTELSWELGRAAFSLEFTADAHPRPGAGEPHVGPVSFVVLGDGEELAAADLAIDSVPERVRTVVKGKQTVTLRVSCEAGVEPAYLILRAALIR